ncbi:type I 3-dehydroquinate dehydratase [Thermodesulfobacteriota bacterium]
MLCIPIIAKDTKEAVEKIAQAESKADITEIRLDLMESFDLSSMIKAAAKPVIITYRTISECGKGDADYDTIAGHLLNAVQEGSDFVDVELSMPQEYRQKIIANKENSKIIISTHINESTPSFDDLKDIFQKSVSTGADIVKIITMAEKWEDNLRVLDLIPISKEQGTELVAFCMGSTGRISRIFSLLLGAYLTFTSLESGQESASGQIPVAEMNKLLKYFKGKQV